MNKIAGVARQVNFIFSTTLGHAEIAPPLHGSLAAKIMDRKGIKSLYQIYINKTQKNFFSSMVVSQLDIPKTKMVAYSTLQYIPNLWHELELKLSDQCVQPTFYCLVWGQFCT